MDEEQINRLATAVNTLRPDWPIGSLRKFITDKLIHRRFQEAAVPLVWVALDPDTRTPARCLEAGPWSDALYAMVFPQKQTPLPPRVDRADLARARAARTPSEDIAELITETRTALRKGATE